MSFGNPQRDATSCSQNHPAPTDQIMRIQTEQGDRQCHEATLRSPAQPQRSIDSPPILRSAEQRCRGDITRGDHHLQATGHDFRPLLSSSTSLRCRSASANSEAPQFSSDSDALGSLRRAASARAGYGGRRERSRWMSSKSMSQSSSRASMSQSSSRARWTSRPTVSVRCNATERLAIGLVATARETSPGVCAGRGNPARGPG